ncbi:hypothetical protein PRN20_18215 [Devosia sp. ZB163]|uniref:hypothetical protein n=1 Tax=Devosia sp. ZB163 TaxID=3025938 RepID=UPI00235F6079|nr:hypothetical protein [Devosia sp. ZB163]MDC9825673.1 hypothetical protein [Devosia sp. ZB163]
MTKITYHAPAGDEAVVTIGGIRLFDGRAEEVDPVEHATLIAKLRTNPHFEVDGVDAGDDEPDDEPDDGEPFVGLRAKHRGRGKYSILRGDEDREVKEGLTKADADAFNALSAEDKEAYVKD